MTAVNAGVHEVGVRLPLQSYSGGHAVFMYSTAADGNVTLQLREPDDLDRSCLAAMLERLQEDSTFSVSYQEGDMLSDGSIDVLLTGGTGTLQGSGATEGVTATFDLFDSSSGPDLTLSPQTFTNSAEAFINENSNSLGVSTETEAVSTTSDDRRSHSVESPGDPSKIGVKRPRPKAASPNRQGPQQCQVCAKVFGNASALAKHKLTHSDERKYACTMCGKAFKRQDHLNGHMLTHRNKKPYECKAEGCGKSYCDARSLRRHTENHHSTNSANVSTTTLSPAQGAASGDAASPHGSSCIQYAPPQTPTTTSGKSQLQQLLATEPVKNGNGGNDGLTKQQLDLIHQIMEQTQRQSQPSSAKPSTKATKHKSTKSQKNWSSTSAQSQNTTSRSGNTSSSLSKVSTAASSPIVPVPKESKPVECNLCHRKFKNIPALNGHMRLHGGYFKKLYCKDSDSKKAEKKDVFGVLPLQTASVSVRALIEEKIINKRAPQISAVNDETTAPPLFPLNVHSSTSPNGIDSKTTSFVVPAPPQQPPEKLRRHSDADAFTMNSTQQEADALADLILKKDKSVIKRTTSDPGHTSDHVLRESLTGVTYQSEDNRNYYAQGLQRIQETMLLESVQTQHMTSVQFQSGHLVQQNEGQLQDLGSLEEYANVTATLQESVKSPAFQSRRPVSQDLQAVLNSPLPEGLADFSTFHSPGYQTHSPAQYAESPHSSIPTQSPLQSPLMRHDSPAFAYPTPPASHEAQSPCFGQHTMIPMVSPSQNDYTNLEEPPPPPSSPLTAAFFTSTMSSAAAVEQALEEVLPGEIISNDDIYSLTNSPPVRSPLPVILTPEPSPVSNVVQSAAPSPHQATTYPASSSGASYPVSPHYQFQSQMLPNSDDPLLSSSPKDTKKKFEFNGVPLKVITSNGVLDLQNSSFTGILVDSNGELKLIQTTGNALQTKNIIVTGTSFIHTHSSGKDSKNGIHKISPVLHCTIPSKPSTFSKSELFVSPTRASPARLPRKRPRSDPLQFPILHQSRLRATRSKPHASSTYTPPPLLNPTRPGSGLYCSIPNRDIREEFLCSVPESDSTPHINIGPKYQCRQLPNPRRSHIVQEPNREHLLWSPVNSFSDSEAVPGGGRNKEYALHLLQICGGNIPEAMLRLMHPTPALPVDHPLLQYQYNDTDRWSSEEISFFVQALFKHDKDFFKIAREIGTKSTKQCVQFYYVWKKVCKEEYRRLKTTREARHACLRQYELEVGDNLHPDANLLGLAETESPLVSQESRSFVCEYSECGATFSSKAALNGHIRIHGGHVRHNSQTLATSVVIERRTITTLCHSESSEDYPCKVCGKIFTKIKSRSAHMKSHRPPDVDANKKKEKDLPACSPTFEVFASSPNPFNT